MIVVKVDWQRCEVLQIQTVKKIIGKNNAMPLGHWIISYMGSILSLDYRT